MHKTFYLSSVPSLLIASHKSEQNPKQLPTPAMAPYISGFVSPNWSLHFWPIWGLNPQPWCYQHHALTNWANLMWELDHRWGWVPKNWCSQIVVLKTLESPLDGKEIKPVNSKRNQPWIFIGRTDLKLKLQHFDHLIQRANSLEKTLMLRKIEGRRRGWLRMR